MTVQAAIKGYICNPSMLQVNADKLLLWYFADKSMSYSATDGINNAYVVLCKPTCSMVTTRSRLYRIQLNTGLTMDICLKFKELSDFLSKYLGIDVCVGADFKIYPVQQLQTHGVFVQVFFLKVRRCALHWC